MLQYFVHQAPRSDIRDHPHTPGQASRANRVNHLRRIVELAPLIAMGGHAKALGGEGDFGELCISGGWAKGFFDETSHGRSSNDLLI